MGTSSRSSKLIHGGLRYLEQFRFGLVREALAERRTLMRIAPHLVHLEPFTVPLHRVAAPGAIPGRRTRALRPARCGLPALPHARVPRKRSIPALRTERLRGAFVYRDGVEDDARLVVAVARTALARGGCSRPGSGPPGSSGRVDGRATGVEATDLVSGEELRIVGDTVIDATGATGGPGGPFAHHAGEVQVMPSVGIHIVLDRARIPATGGLTMRIPGRVLFLIPWGTPLDRGHHATILGRPRGPAHGTRRPGGRGARQPQRDHRPAGRPRGRHRDVRGHPAARGELRRVHRHGIAGSMSWTARCPAC